MGDAETELAAWHAECDKVGVPYDPEGLVRHHRNNVEFAMGNYKLAAEHWRERSERAEADLAEAMTVIERLLAEAADQERRWQASHQYARISEYRRRTRAAEQELAALKAAADSR